MDMEEQDLVNLEHSPRKPVLAHPSWSAVAIGSKVIRLGGGGSDRLLTTGSSVWLQ